MNAFAKGHVVVLGSEEGESFWQPLPSRGYIVNKLTPYNTPYDNFSLGIQVLEPGAHIRRHAHERQHEVLFCYAGEGWAEVDGQRHTVQPETTLLIREAKARGCGVITGVEMFVRQAARQFELFTNKTPDLDKMREIVRKAMSPITRAPAMALIAAVLSSASVPKFTVVVPE